MITLDDLKEHLNITDSNDDALLQRTLDAATFWISTYTGYVLPDGVTEYPTDLQQACRVLCAAWYDDREGSQEIPSAVFLIAASYRAAVF